MCVCVCVCVCVCACGRRGDIEAAHTQAHAFSLEKHPLQHPGQRQCRGPPASHSVRSADVPDARCLPTPPSSPPDPPGTKEQLDACFRLPCRAPGLVFLRRSRAAAEQSCGIKSSGTGVPDRNLLS